MSEPELKLRNISYRGYVFDDFTLDLDRGCLWRAGEEIKLRHKSFEALRYLVEHNGRLVSKAEMIQALWPDAFVTDDSLVQCLIEVRRALGDDEHQYVRTILRRGYIFDAQVKASYQSASETSDISDTALDDDLSAAIEEQEQREEDWQLKNGERDDTVSVKSTTAPGRRWPHPKFLPAIFLILVTLTAWLVLNLVNWVQRSSWIRPAKTVAEVGSIAVLPFKSLDSAGGDEYLGVGMADDLITRLSNLQRVVVLPTSSVLKYANGETSAVAAGKALGVESVLEGSIRRSGDRIRVTVQLVSVRDGSSLWAEKFDEKFTDILSLQDAVAERVSQSLVSRLTRDERKLLTKRYTNNDEAYKHYLNARFFLVKRTEIGYRRCLEQFQQAINLDQNYAPAYAGMADVYNLMGLYVFALLPPREAFPKAKEAAEKALKIDGALGEAHSALGFAKMNYDWNWAEVERDFKRAIELNPNDSTIQHYYSHYWMARGQTEKSLAASLRALDIEPFDLVPLNSHLGWHYLQARQYPQAVEQLLKTIELDSNFVSAHLFLGFVYEHQGNNEAAITEFNKAVILSEEGRRPVMEAALGHAYALAGKKNEAQRVLARLKDNAQRRFISPYGIAMLYLGLGDKEQAFIWLNRAYDERDNWLNYLKVEPRLDPLRTDPRFIDLVRRVGLEP